MEYTKEELEQRLQLLRAEIELLDDAILEVSIHRIWYYCAYTHGVDRPKTGLDPGHVRSAKREITNWLRLLYAANDTHDAYHRTRSYLSELGLSEDFADDIKRVDAART